MTLPTSKLIHDLNTAITKPNIPFTQLYNEALDFSMGILGKYYYFADSVEDNTASNETGQLSSSLMTYQHLVNLLKQIVKHLDIYQLLPAAWLKT